MDGVLKAFLSAIVLAVLAWVGCAVWDEIASETGSFPNGLLCVLTWAAAVAGWVWLNFGNALGRGAR